ncbi:MAG TPA: hypothetical protein DFR83_22735, partial [Deltaproteobacteria bacterium]|nr:hypothetical protein [Deltaproteobacteria bacterium]
DAPSLAVSIGMVDSWPSLWRAIVETRQWGVAWGAFGGVGGVNPNARGCRSPRSDLISVVV